MKVVSFNIYKRNKKLETVLSFIKDGEFDVVCLQEVPIEVVENFLQLAPYSHVADEYVEYGRTGRIDHLKLVILSWLPITKTTVTKHKKHETNSKKYRQFELEFQSVVVRYKRKLIRINNVHFKCVAGPLYRLESLDEVIESLPSVRRSIICGDFNTFGRIWTNIFLYKIFKYSKSEVLINEYQALNDKIIQHNYHNSLEGLSTFSRLPLQLDYILVSKDMLVLERVKYKQRFGSDHHPIMVLIALLG